MYCELLNKNSLKKSKNFKCLTRELHLAIGIFDGLHLGHQAVIRTAIYSAKKNNGCSGVLTFNPHPSVVLKNSSQAKLIMHPKIRLLDLVNMGIDKVFQIKFTIEFARISAKLFLPLLKSRFPDLKAIYIGNDFRFGIKRSGTISTLVKTGIMLGIRIYSIGNIKQNEKKISSTQIRKELIQGNIKYANTLLGYRYYSQSKVIEGAHRGKLLGFPTLNFYWENELQVKYGVYIVFLIDLCRKKRLRAIANFGLRPTIANDRNPVLEVHSLEYTLLSINEKAKIEWLDFLRPEKKFQSIKALKIQIKEDCKRAIKIFDKKF